MSEEVADSSQGSIAGAFHWLAGTSPVARSLRIAAAVPLLFWGAVDLLHFYWANVSADFSSLRRAASLNPNDSSLQLHLARAAEAVGNRDAALAALKDAAKVNPRNLSLRQAYARARFPQLAVEALTLSISHTPSP